MSFVINPYTFTANLPLWLDLTNTLGRSVSGFKVTFNGPAVVNWGDGTTTTLTSNVAAPTKALGITTSISLQTNNTIVTAIDCGTSVLKFEGTIDVSAFPDLTSIVCRNNGITRFQGYGALTNLVEIDMRDNNFVQSSFETFDNKPNLQIVNFGTSTSNGHIGMTGPFPTFPQNLNLTTLAINNTSLTGSNINLSHLTNLTSLQILGNALTGSFPVLPTGANSKLVTIQVGQNKSAYRFTGTPPLFSDHPNLTQLFYAINSATGSIQSIPSRAINFQCHANQHTGNIPSMAGTALGVFLCHTNQLTGFAGGAVPASLGNFQAQNNQLTASAVNALLAAFVAAGKTTGARTIDLAGTGNAAPTGQGLIDRQTLLDRGWRTASGSTAITN